MAGGYLHQEQNFLELQGFMKVALYLEIDSKI